MSATFDFFNAARVNAVMQGAYDPRLNPQPLVWDRRIPTVAATDEEILARFISFPMTADLIADDAAAVVYQFGKFQYDTYKIPKLKAGIPLNESMLRQLERIRTNMATRDEQGIFTDWERRIVSSARYMVDIRREALLIAMLFDGLSYDRFGIKLNGVTWGMYSDLKVTPGTAWSSTSATPITDIQTVRRTARMRYGINYNRVTMSSQALIYAAATTEFQTLSKYFVTPFLFGAPAPTSPLSNDAMLANLMGNILSGVPGGDVGGLGPMTIELDDRRFWTQAADGSVISSPLWPTAGVVLSDSTQDGNAATWNFGNTPLMEKVVSDLVGSGAASVAAGYGPTVYPTVANAQLNPPGLNYWGVQRGMPRKAILQANAALTVGTFSDSISTALPF
jgi:hypothetical protein